jgi:hypothetical protein
VNDRHETWTEQRRRHILERIRLDARTRAAGERLGFATDGTRYDVTITFERRRGFRAVGETVQRTERNLRWDGGVQTGLLEMYAPRGDHEISRYIDPAAVVAVSPASPATRHRQQPAPGSAVRTD